VDYDWRGEGRIPFIASTILVFREVEIFYWWVESGGFKALVFDGALSSAL
jgi:hypothetical protein